mmetsp:Transcript_28940/g.65586  ORF Transcript_28940/g.65586 Transcript_28940/m.65586 type:complete len:492 (-) Transcript_28940:31-1506(-)
MSSFLGRLSQGIGGVSQDEEDINSPIAFSRGRDTGLRRNWVEGSWASGSRSGRPEKSPSKPFLSIILISAFFIFAMVVSVMWYGGKDQFNLNNMLPWSSGETSSSSRPSLGSERMRGREEQSRAEEANAKLRYKYHEALRDVRGLESKVGELEHVVRENSRVAKQQGSLRGQDGALVEEKLKYEAAEREVDALESKVEQLEREALKQKMKMRQGQASDLGQASKEISNLQDTMERLEELEVRRSKEQRMSEKQIAALEKENEKLELSLEDREQDKQEIKALTDKVEELSRNSAAARRSRESGEIKKIEEAIKAHLKVEENRVAKLTRQQIKLKAELEAARAEAQQYRKVQKNARRRPVRSFRPIRRSNREGTGKHLSYEDEVQQKEKKEEENISRQAARMMDHREEERGLDKRHRRMLENMEKSQEVRDRRADRAADRDLKVREKEIDQLLGTNTNCPGPNCMTKKVDPSIKQATDYARSRFASGGKLRFQ